MPANWKPKGAVPRYEEPSLVRMVQLANMARMQNMTPVQMNKKTMDEKKAMVLSESSKFQYNIMCSRGQIKPERYNRIFPRLNLGLPEISRNNTITDADITNGFMIFSIIVYCSESVALSQFYHNLLSTESPKTVIKATVNTIESKNLKERILRENINKVFMTLNKVIISSLEKFTWQQPISCSFRI